ncbi:MAG: sugar phosphate isomerase/epimerase family protein [Thermoanaerobaculia bacterium]
MNRREFLAAAGAVAVGGCSVMMNAPREQPFRISLAQWSLHRAIRGGALDPLDFPLAARRDYGIEAVEYVNTLFGRRDDAWLRALRDRAADAGVRSLLIMCDGEGALGDPDEAARAAAVANHARWIDAAALLGCHSIRVNAQSRGTPAEQQQRVADGLRRLCEIGDRAGINVLVENHGGLSSDAEWLAATIRAVDHPRAGTLPDFGNFRIDDNREFDRYRGVALLMPYARAVSAKSHAFDAQGNETSTDYFRMMRIVLDAGYHGFVGIEYEGKTLSEPEGIRATKALLERVRSSADLHRG